jgi:xanthine dehydrogenase accessory factor
MQMADRRRIVRQWQQGGATALVTLVRAEGSSYRRPGAHLLVAADGISAGTISGGCLEAEVVRKAAWIVRDGAVVERYSTLFDDTAEIPFGLGCGGIVDLLIEPADTPECRAYLDALGRSLAGEASIVLTRLPIDGARLARTVLNPDGSALFTSAGAPFAASGTESVTNFPTGILSHDPRLFVDRLNPPQRLFVLGAGDDAIPVVRIAALLGWNVTVADGRAQLAIPARFPDAQRVLTANGIAQLDIKSGDAVVLMTHSYEQDRALLTQLLRDPGPHFIGVLGAAHRSSLLISEAAAALGLTLAECCDRIHAPIGLDLGGDGPEPIALAIVAQIQAWLQGKLQDAPASSRKLSPQFIADQIAQGGASRYLQTQCAVDLPRP